MPVTMPTVQQVLELPPLMEQTIPPEWLDLNGHVNVRHYLALYDAASWPMLAAMGLDERTFLEHRQGIFDLEHHLWYLDELHVGDTVTVHWRFVARTVKRFHGVMFIVNRTRQRLASVFEYVSTGADLDARRTAPLPAAFAAEIDRHLARDAQLDWPPPGCGVMAP